MEASKVLYLKATKPNVPTHSDFSLYPHNVPKETLPDLEPWFSVRNFFFSRQKWTLHLFLCYFSWSPRTRCLAETSVKARYNSTSLPWQTPAQIHAVLATNQPVSDLCVFLYLFYWGLVSVCIVTQLSSVLHRHSWRQRPAFGLCCSFLTVIRILEVKRAFLTDLLLLTARFQSCI